CILSRPMRLVLSSRFIFIALIGLLHTATLSRAQLAPITAVSNLDQPSPEPNQAPVGMGPLFNFSLATSFTTGDTGGDLYAAVLHIKSMWLPEGVEMFGPLFLGLYGGFAEEPVTFMTDLVLDVPPFEDGNYMFYGSAALIPNHQYWLVASTNEWGNYLLGTVNSLTTDPTSLPGWSVGNMHMQSNGGTWGSGPEGSAALHFAILLSPETQNPNPLTPVPEPSTYAACGALLLVGVIVRRRVKRSKLAALPAAVA
ncbi:MAG: choice-of-anchor R domain-containing protein, partial [Verrucomicrobiota bacterium]